MIIELINNNQIVQLMIGTSLDSNHLILSLIKSIIVLNQLSLIESIIVSITFITSNSFVSEIVKINDCLDLWSNTSVQKFQFTIPPVCSVGFGRCKHQNMWLNRTHTAMTFSSEKLWQKMLSPPWFPAHKSYAKI